MGEHPVVIAQAASPDEIVSARGLMREYISWAFTLAGDADKAPTFQGIEDELATLPGISAPPAGRLLLATQGGRAAGCVCLKPHDRATCELKRLYVSPEMRGLSIGQLLVDRLVAEARDAGYNRIVLDSHKSMVRAHEIYEAAGFCRVSAPADFPEEIRQVAIFMECYLDRAAVRPS